MLNIETVLDRVTVVDFYYFDIFVNSAFPELGNEYEFVAAIEATSNYCYYLFEGVGKNKTERSTISKNSHPHTLLNLVCQEGLIPAGNYLIKLYW